MILAVASASRPAAARLASGGFGTTALLFFRRTISLASLVHFINRHGKSLPARLNAKISSAISSEGTHMPDTTLQLPALLLYRPLVRNRPNSSGRLGVANQFSTASLARSGQSIFPIGRLDCSIAFVSIRGRDLLSSRWIPRRRVDAARPE